MYDTVPYEGHYEKLAEYFEQLALPRKSSKPVEQMFVALDSVYNRFEAERVIDLWLSGWDCLARKVMR